jgi:hypothetical protein
MSGISRFHEAIGDLSSSHKPRRERSSNHQEDLSVLDKFYIAMETLRRNDVAVIQYDAVLQFIEILGVLVGDDRS